MRKIAVLILAAAGVSLAGAASAADIAARPIYTKAAPAPMVPWTGCYIGLYLGGDAARRVRATDTLEGTTTYTPKAGVIAGYEGGCNYQFAPNMVIGYESETGYMKIKGTGAFPAPSTDVNTIETGAMVSTLAARFGVLIDPKTMVYAKGGLAYTRLDSHNFGPISGDFGGDHKTMFGYAAGAGVEFMLDPKWSIKAEYLYLGFNKDITYGVLNSGTITTAHFDGVHTAKIGLNYKWDWFSLLR
jgi:outer membrane immunogenic protein